MRKRPDHICVDCLCTYTGFGKQLRCPDCQRKHRVQATQACMARKQDGTGRMVGRTYYCVQCNKPFVLKGGNQRFCPECAEKRKRPERTYTGALFDAPATQPTQDKSTCESDAIVARFLAGENQTANALYIQRWRQGSGYYVPDKEE